MKCYSYILIIFFSLFQTFQVYSQIPITTAPSESAVEKIAEIDLVVPLLDHDIESGEIYKVKIISSKSYEELLEFKNQRINEVMFVTEVIDSQLDGLLFEVFVTTPPKGKKEKEYPFRFEKFKYKNNKKNLQGELKTLSVDNPFDFSDLNFYMKYKWIALILVTIFFAGLIFLIREIYFSRKKKKEFKAKALSLIRFIENAEAKEDFEQIHADRITIKKYIDIDDKAFTKLLSKINDYQFQKSWKEEYSKEIIALKKDLDIRGINRGI